MAHERNPQRRARVVGVAALSAACLIASLAIAVPAGALTASPASAPATAAKDTTRPEVELVTPTGPGPFRTLNIQVEATDAGGLKRITANIYQGAKLVKSTQTNAKGATSATHTASVPLPSGEYTIKYNAQDTAGNTSATSTFAVTIDKDLANLKPRVIVQSDISSPDNEPDDIQSFVHLLSLADQYEIEALIATTGYAFLGSYNVDSEVNGVTFKAAAKGAILNDLPGGDRMEFSDNVDVEGSTELGGAVAPFSRLSGEYETLLRSGFTNEGLSSSASSSRMSLRVRNLEPGRQYEVQFWVNDYRADVLGQPGNGLFTTIASGNSSVRVQHNSANALGGTGHVVTGTFTAGNDQGRQKTINFTGGTSTPGNGSAADVVGTVNAYQIRDITDDPSAPGGAPGGPIVWSTPAVISSDEDVSVRGEGLRAVNFTRTHDEYRFELPPEPQNFLRIIDAYEKDLPNLMARSGQKGFMEDESQPQAVGYWPSADYLRERVTVGQRLRGYTEFGDGQSTDGSERTIEIVDEDDARPVTVQVWGSGNTFAQSVWDVRDRRSPEEVKQFLSKVTLYTIGDQDCRNTALETNPCWDGSTMTWLRKTHQNDLRYVWASNYRAYMNKMSAAWSVYAPQIQASGNLGKEYAIPVYGIEGDTPSFLYDMPGMNDPKDPTQSSYGGAFELGTNPDGSTTYRDQNAANNNLAYDLTFDDQLNDFLTRMQWADTGAGNRNPVAIVNGDTTYDVVSVTAEVGQTVKVSAAGSTDPDGDSLTYQWRVDKPAGYAGDLTFASGRPGEATFSVPADAAGKEIHVLLRVTDDGSPALSAWRRVIVNVAG